MFCENCGKNLPDSVKFCDGCGTKVDAPQPAYASVAQAAPPQAPPPQGYAPPPSYAPPQPAYAPAQPAYAPQSDSEPLRVAQYVGMLLLMFIPIANIVLLFVWGFGSTSNLNKKNYARAMLIVAAIGLALSFILSSILAGIMASLFHQLF